jgi:tetratricopeptide (TPR) repeat protein
MSAGQRGFDPATPLAPTATGLIQLQELRIGSVVAERFRVERILGMGGMGLVYLAKDLELDIEVALKQLRPELASRGDAFERFRKELLLARLVSSPHVVRIHDLVRHEQTWLISMDFVAGRSLERLLQEEGVLDPPRALAITRQIALGLAAAHASGVVHRDLKPANILVDDQDQARITDFGVARAAGDTGITGSGVVIGTPEYLSPEQARAEALDGRSDLYALGLILYEMLTGTLPFRGGTPAEMMIQRVVKAPPRADTVRADLPAFAVELCARLLALAPNDRLASGEAVVAAIDSGELARLAAPKLPRRPYLDRRLLWLLPVALLAGWLVLQQGSGDPPPVVSAVESPASLDLMPLPWAVQSAEAADSLQAEAVWHLLAERLTLAPQLRSADPGRVRRVLTELGFDASAADRQHDRVLAVSGARAVLEGDWQRTEAGLDLRLRLVRPDEAQPHWQWQRLAIANEALPAALADMAQSLGLALGGDAAEVLAQPWPGAERLEAIGAWVRATPMERADRSPEGALADWPPSVLWLWLDGLDRSGMKAQAATAARRVLEALPEDTGSPKHIRVRAFADLLVGNADRATGPLEALVIRAPSDLPARRLLARARAEQGSLDQAIATLQEVLEVDPGDGQAWFEQAKYALQTGDSKRAVDDLLVRAQVIANRLEDPWLRADVGNALGIGYRRLGQMDAAAEELERTIALRQKLGDERGQAASLSNLSMVRMIQGDFAAARQALALARQLIEPLGDAGALADLATDTGLLAEEEGDFNAALSAYREGLGLRQAQGDKRSIAESLLNVGFAYFQLGEFDNAQTYWAQARSHYLELDDKVGLVHSQESLGLAGTARGEWATAREELQSGLLTAESQQMDEEQANALAILAELDRLEGRIDQALARSDQALAMFTRRGDQRGIVEMHLLRAQALLDVGAWEAAAAALAVFDDEPPGSAEQQAMLALRRAELALGLEDSVAALDAAVQAVALAGEAHALGLQLQAQLMHARALRRSGNASEALATLAQVDAGLGRYASVPLRLLLAETHLRLDSPERAQVWRGSEALLARLPSYGRAWRLLSLALPYAGDEEMATRRVQLTREIGRIDAALPAELRPAFARAAERLAPSSDEGENSP